MTMRTSVGLGAAGLVAAGGLWYALSDSGASEIDSARLATVERGAMVRSVVATGKIEPVSIVEIKSKANGIIKELHVDVGQLVEEGDVLVELDRENLTARVREARANLQAAQAAQAAAEAQLAKSTIEAEGPEVELARRTFERAQTLASEELVADSSLDEARTALEQAENNQRAAKSQLQIAEARVAEAIAFVAQAQAAADRADEELSNATIRAPIRGTILAREVEVGSPVSSILNLGAAATPVMTVGDISSVFVRGQVDEADVGQVRLGQEARITVETFKDRVFSGRVTQVSPLGVEQDNVTNFEVKVSIENSGDELKANMTANAEIVLEERPGVLIVPEAALTYDAERQPFVELFEPAQPEQTRRVPVEIGISNGVRTEISTGLSEGDRVLLPN